MASTVAIRTQKRTASRASQNLDQLFTAWQEDADQNARELLVNRFSPLARGLARRYDRSSEPFDDLLQVAMLGLLKAIDRFDPERGYAFASFAVPTILGEMRRYFRDCGWGVHVPRSLQERTLKVGEAQELLTRERGRAPSVIDLATYLELSVEEVNEALQTARVYDVMSLDAPRSSEDGESQSFGETVGQLDERYELIELDATLSSAFGEIPQRERAILHMRFVEELTQTQIAERIGISQMQVSRLLRRSLDTLRALTAA
jgi:RNA polymerase sigma-B factor